MERVDVRGGVASSLGGVVLAEAWLSLARESVHDIFTVGLSFEVTRSAYSINNTSGYLLSPRDERSVIASCSVLVKHQGSRLRRG